MNTEEKSTYFKELALNLRREGFTVDQPEGNFLQVDLEGRQLCRISRTGGLGAFEEDAVSHEAALERVQRITCATQEYMNLLEKSPPLTADGVDEGYKLLAEFDSTVFAGKMTKYGAQFITWEWVHDRTSLWQGHYYGPGGGIKDYYDAKQDFAVRSGLIPRGALFTQEQLAEICRSIHETLENACPLTDERQKRLESIAKQIEQSLPDLEARAELFHQQKAAPEVAESPQDGGMQLL